MIGLPKLLHRAFVVGYLLPSVLFCLYIIMALGSDHQPIQDAYQSLSPKLVGQSFAAIIISIVLTALNRPIIRLLEGYGDYNPLRILLPLVRRRFRASVKPLYEEANRVEEARKVDPQAKPEIEGFSKKLSQAATGYPDREDLLLPTRFGNVYRAFEVYSRVTYGLDAIPAWPRLQLLLPIRTQDQLRDARSYLDFNVNILVLSVVAICGLVIYNIFQGPIDLHYLVLPITSSIYCWLMLPISAKQWGETVRSVFDLYRGQLARELGFRLPSKIEDERLMWREVSRFMLFRIAGPLTELEEFRIVQSKPPRRRASRRRRSRTESASPPNPQSN